MIPQAMLSILWLDWELMIERACRAKVSEAELWTAIKSEKVEGYFFVYIFVSILYIITTQNTTNNEFKSDGSHDCITIFINDSCILLKRPHYTKESIYPQSKDQYGISIKTCFPKRRIHASETKRKVVS